MSTSFMYHAFGATAHDYLRTEYRGGAIYLHVETKRSRVRCSECGSPATICEGRVKRSVRGVPIGSKQVFIVCHLRLLRCDTCGALRQERRRLADPRKSYTRRFARLVLDLAERMTLSDVARFLKTSWSVIKDIVASDLLRRSKRRSFSDVRVIAIDEFAIRKGHKYATVVVNLRNGRVLFCAEGRDHACLEPFFAVLRD